MGTWGAAGIEAWSRTASLCPELSAHGTEAMQFVKEGGMKVLEADVEQMTSAAVPAAFGSQAPCLPEPMGGPSITERVDDLATRRCENAFWRLMQKQSKTCIDGCKQEHIMLMAKQTIGRELDFPRRGTPKDCDSQLAEPLGGPMLSRRMRTLCADIDERRIQNALWRLRLQKQYVPKDSSCAAESSGSSTAQAREAIGLQINFRTLRQLKLKQAMLGLHGFAMHLPTGEPGESTKEPTPRSYVSECSIVQENSSMGEGSKTSDKAAMGLPIESCVTLAWYAAGFVTMFGLGLAALQLRRASTGARA